MSHPLIQNFILTFGFIAFMAGAVRVAVAFPAAMHNVGVLVPHTASRLSRSTASPEFQP